MRVYICAQQHSAKLMANLLLEFSINMVIYFTSCEKAIYAPHKRHSEFLKRGSFMLEIAFLAPVYLYETGKTVKKTIGLCMKIDDIFVKSFPIVKTADSLKRMLFVL